MNMETKAVRNGAEAEARAAMYDAGRITGHGSDPDGSPDIGYSVGLGGGRMLWVGEISERLFAETGASGSDLGGSGGTWLIVYGQERGNTHVLGKAIDSLDANALCCAVSASLAAPSAAGGGEIREDQGALEWALARWKAEVCNRPIRNVHRRALDTTWRQVIRQFGGDPDALVGPSHDALASADGSGEAGETEGLDSKGNSAVGAAETPSSPTAPQGADLAGLSAAAISDAMLETFFEGETKPWTFYASHLQPHEKDIWRRRIARVLALALAHPGSVAPTSGERGQEPAASRDVLTERRRQVEAEGWTPEHDDRHTHGEMLDAALCYVQRISDTRMFGSSGMSTAPARWPWDLAWWKPSDPRRDLVKAGALILAEIERLDRARNEGERP